MKCPMCGKTLPLKDYETRQDHLCLLFICECNYAGYVYFREPERDVTYVQGMSGIVYNPSRRDSGIKKEIVRYYRGER